MSFRASAHSLVLFAHVRDSDPSRHSVRRHTLKATTM